MTMFQHLPDAELLAAVVGPVSAQKAWHTAGGSFRNLLNDTIVPYDLDPRVQARLQAAKEIVRRMLLESLRQRDCLSSPQQTREFLRLSLGGRDREVFLVLFLDAKNCLIASEELFQGTLTETSVYPREVVRRALHHNAGSVILAHNHPSGALAASRADETLTRTLKSALALVDVSVLDHVIVGEAGALSFAERGLL